MLKLSRLADYATVLMCRMTREPEAAQSAAQLAEALGLPLPTVAKLLKRLTRAALLSSERGGKGLEVLEAHFRDKGEFSLGGLPYTEMRKTLPVLIFDIKDGAKRIERIVADLKNFARPHGSNTWVLFSLNDVVKLSVRLLNHLIGSKTKHFKTELTEPLALLRGDPQQVEQVIVNLLVNALEAIPDQDCGVTIATFSDNGAHKVILEVRDEGTGIAPEHLEQLCDPFFTTKQASGGTGLGLAITASLVRAHGGDLSFSSVLAKGTSARAIFPGIPL